MSEPSAVESLLAAGRWSRRLDALRELDPRWTEAYARMAIDPWTRGALPAKEAQLIAIGLCAAITSLDESALRRHLRAALHAGATRTEILEVLKMAALLSLHSMSLGAPILIEEARASAKAAVAERDPTFVTPVCDQMKAIGQWNAAWDPFAALDPLWTERCMAAGVDFYTNGVLTPKFVELISVAFDASITHMYAPGTRRHVKAALALGASVEEILTVLKLCVSMGANALDVAIPIFAQEAEAFEASGGAPGFVEAIALAELPPGRGTAVAIGGKQVALFNAGGQIFATDDSCPHAGSSLGWGKLEGNVVRCRAHGLCFDVTTGEVVGGAGLSIKTYPTRIDGDKVAVRLS